MYRRGPGAVVVLGAVCINVDSRGCVSRPGSWRGAVATVAGAVAQAAVCIGEDLRGCVSRPGSWRGAVATVAGAVVQAAVCIGEDLVGCVSRPGSWPECPEGPQICVLRRSPPLVGGLVVGGSKRRPAAQPRRAVTWKNAKNGWNVRTCRSTGARSAPDGGAERPGLFQNSDFPPLHPPRKIKEPSTARLYI